MRTSQALDDLLSLDRLALQAAPVQQLTALTKLIVTGAFIITVVSFHRYEVFRLIALGAYPLVMLMLLQVPTRVVLRYLLIAAPFALMIGAFNPLLDRQIVAYWGRAAVSGGWLSFFSIVLRFLLTVSAALVLLAGTGFPQLCRALNQLHVPKLLVTQFLLLYRFLFILLEQAQRMHRAYHLRAARARGMPIRIWGSLAGHLLLRAYDRGLRLHQAMRARGFDGAMRTRRVSGWSGWDVGFALLSIAFFMIVRFAGPVEVLGRAALQLLTR